MKVLKLIGLANEFVLAGGAEMPSIIKMPYGTYEYGVAEIPVAGKPKKFNVRQVFDREGALSIANEVSDRMKKGGKGTPVYQGHPDVDALAAKYPMKAAIGWIENCKALANEAELTVRWLTNPGEGFSHFSPYWTGQWKLANEGGDNAVMTVRKLVSLALTNEPNIKDFRLPNEEQDSEEDDSLSQSATGGSSLPPESSEGVQDMDIKLLAKALGLPETATQEQIMAKIEELKAQPAALENEIEKQKTACANEKKLRVEMIVGRAIEEGRITGAQKAVWEGRLANETAFDAELQALANEQPKLKLAPIAPARQDQSKPAVKNHEKIVALANEKQKANPGMDWSTAYLSVKADQPELFK
jgi:hypothetical protein